MTDPLDLEHQRRTRAERVVAMLQALWGDDLPAGPHPELTVLIDAIAIDDEHATSQRLVNHGDGLTYDLLAALCTQLLRITAAGDSFPASLIAQLPPALLTTLQQLNLLPRRSDQQEPFDTFPTASRQLPVPVRPPAFDDVSAFDTLHGVNGSSGVLADPIGPRPAATTAGAPSAQVGMWEVDPLTRTIAYDAVCATLMGLIDLAGGYTNLDRLLDELVHPADRAHIEHAMRYALRTETTYRVRFRVLYPGSNVTWLISQGRVLRKPSDTGPRLTGYLILDPVTHPSAELIELA